jgi:hypothetical protein
MSNPESASAPSHVTIDVAALQRRKDAIADERAPLLAKLHHLDEEERRIDTILSYASDTRFTVGAPLSALANRALRQGGHAAPRVTHRVICVLALERYPEGAPVSYIVNWGVAANVADRIVTKTSISPLLKKMSDPKRKMLEVEHDEAGRRWVITEKGRATAKAFRREWIEAGRAPFWDSAPDAAEGPK